MNYCLCCKKETKNPKFCSHSCSAKYNSPRIQKVPRHRCENPECNNLTKNPHFCSRLCGRIIKKSSAIQRFLDGKLTDSQVRKSYIRNYLIERQNGVCDICKKPPIWNSKPLVLIIDHVDGNYENNSPDNIRAVCPNCNSQTDTFGGKNKTKHVIKRATPNQRKGYKTK